MAEPQTAKSNDADQTTDSADGAAGDAALKAIAHLQRVAETLSSDAAKLNADASTDKPIDKAQTADKVPESAKSTERVKLPALAAPKAGARPGPRAAVSAGWQAGLRARLESVVWSHVAAAAVLMFAVAGGAYLGLMDYLDRKDAQRVAAEEALRHPPETAAERELRGKIAELHLDLQSLRGQMNKLAAEARAAQTQAAGAAAATQSAARVEKLGKELSTKLDGQVARIERLERIAADPIVTSSIAKDQKDQKGQPTSAAGAPAPVRQGLRTPDPTMKPNTFVLRSVRNGVAMVQTRNGMLEVGPGDRIPGVGRVRSIEKLDGRWVLVMHDGYIDQDDY
ncbi:MAG TPA: hypothetical protein PKA55_10645 [Rhodoblastus sp.]|nr:hypothetical protein [Rhodoblastus sp.]